MEHGAVQRASRTTRGGRPKALTGDQVRDAARMHADGMTQEQIAAALGVSRTTVGRYLRSIAPPLEILDSEVPQAEQPKDEAARPTRPPSLADVARLAGVSYQTVSRVVNDQPKVGRSTRARVLEVMEQVGYRRNLAARSLVTGRSGTIGIITDCSFRLGPMRTLLALETAVRAAGFVATVVTIDEPFGESIPMAIARLEEVGVEGLIVIPTVKSQARAVRGTTARVPVELIAAGEPIGPRLLTFSEDQERGARIATRHLIEQGHTNIVHLAGSQQWFDGIVRNKGYRREMGNAGLEPRSLEGDWTPRWAYETGLRFVAEGLPDAIFAASDHSALALYRAFAENGIRIPQDISIVGFDDLEASDYFYPPLTTVRQDFTGLGQRAVELLVAAIEGHSIDPTPIIPLFIERDSTTAKR